MVTWMHTDIHTCVMYNKWIMESWTIPYSLKLCFFTQWIKWKFLGQLPCAKTTLHINWHFQVLRASITKLLDLWHITSLEQTAHILICDLNFTFVYKMHDILKYWCRNILNQNLLPLHLLEVAWKHAVKVGDTSQDELVNFELFPFNFQNYIGVFLVFICNLDSLTQTPFSLPNSRLKWHCLQLRK